MRNSFVLYTDYKQHIDLLSVEEKAQLLDAIFSYAEGNEVDLDGMAKMAFSFIRSQMDKDNEKYQQICEKRRNAGQKGGLAKQDKANQANAKSAKQSKANEADNGDSLSLSSSLSLSVKEIISYLNLKTGRSYKATSKSTKEHINARLAEGFTVDDFKRVIDHKTAQWINDPKMSEYLRPETLFCSKFEGYLQSAPKPKLEVVKPKPPDNRVVYDCEDFETRSKYSAMGYKIRDGYWIDANGNWVLKESS